MELILLEKVQNLGDLGDKVTVKPGFGRNYLVPQGKAVPATKKNIEMFESQREELERKAAEQLGSAVTRLEALSEVKADFVVNASPEGKLYGSVGPREIADKLTGMGFPVQKSEVILTEGPIRFVGEHEVHLQFHADVGTTITVDVQPEEQVTPEE